MTAIQRPTGSDHHEKLLLANIDEFGWHCVNVSEHDGHPPWAYTIGLYHSWNEAEFIIIGRSRATSGRILHELAARSEAGEAPNLAEPTLELIPGQLCLFVEVAARHYPEYVPFGR